MPKRYHQAPLTTVETVSSDGSVLHTHDRPKKEDAVVFLEKIAWSTNQEQEFAKCEAYFLTDDDTAIDIKETMMNGLRAGIILNPPVIWTVKDRLRLLIVINSGTSTVIVSKAYWSYEEK